MLFETQNLSLRRGARKVLDGISLSIGPGEFVGLIGPNGAGKTSFLRASLGLLHASGRANLARMSAEARARAVAYLPQEREINWPLSVERLVGLGRSGFGAGAAADAKAVTDALAALDLLPMRQRAATELSGGEQARVLLARALAQETPLLLADEPTAGLDPAAQLGAMELFAGLAKGGKAVLASLHDLGLAARYCTRLVILDQGRLVADGAPSEVLTPQRIAEVFAIKARIEADAAGVLFQPLSRL